MANYIYPAPGATNDVKLTLSVNANGSDTGYELPSLQDITVNNSNDVFTWTQLDAGSKKQIATTATNSVSMNLVVDQDTFFGTAADYDALTVTGNVATEYGVFGLSNKKVLVDFTLELGYESDGTAGKTLTGSAYVTGLAPTVSADSPVWVTPVTLTVDGDYTVGNMS